MLTLALRGLTLVGLANLPAILVQKAVRPLIKSWMDGKQYEAAHERAVYCMAELEKRGLSHKLREATYYQEMAHDALTYQIMLMLTDTFPTVTPSTRWGKLASSLTYANAKHLVRGHLVRYFEDDTMIVVFLAPDAAYVEVSVANFQELTHTVTRHYP